jgi:hypothetical protein
MAFDFDSLILLVGTNPLPNLVTAEFFIQDNPHLKNIFLVHSDLNDYQDGTREQAERLQKVIGNIKECKGKFQFEKIHLSDVGNRTITFKDLRERLIPKLKEKKVRSLHVNYTGGTKVMAVHVYRFIEKELTDKQVNKKSFSYLDGRCFKIVNDDSDVFISKDLRETTTISFDEILNVHGFVWNSDRNSEVISTESLQRIKEEIDSGDIEELKKNMCDFYNKFRKIKSKWKELKKSAKTGFEGFSLKDNDLVDLLPVLNGMPEKFRFFDEMGKLDLSKFDFDSNDNGPFTKFFNGLWLEQYIYYILKTGLKNDNICLERNWEIEKEDWDTYFQLDVILKKGFQLFGISCTVENEKGSCKLKGFEIIHRVRQIGGDEAKAVVITMLKDNTAKTLQKELQQDSGIPEGYIKVFGKNDLESDNFLEEINDFIN